jgi:hypothetical protein
MWPVTWPYELSVEIADLVIDQAGPMIDETSVKRRRRLSSPDLESNAGTYFAEPGVLTHVVVEDDALRLVRPSPRAYALHAPATLARTETPDEFRVLDGRGAGELARFGRDEKGGVISFTLGGFIYQRTD